jgi:hypothetical protein
VIQKTRQVRTQCSSDTVRVLLLSIVFVTWRIRLWQHVKMPKRIYVILSPISQTAITASSTNTLVFRSCSPSTWLTTVLCYLCHSFAHISVSQDDWASFDSDRFMWQECQCFFFLQMCICESHLFSNQFKFSTWFLSHTITDLADHTI